MFEKRLQHFYIHTQLIIHTTHLILPISSLNSPIFYRLPYRSPRHKPTHINVSLFSPSTKFPSIPTQIHSIPTLPTLQRHSLHPTHSSHNLTPLKYPSNPYHINVYPYFPTQSHLSIPNHRHIPYRINYPI